MINLWEYANAGRIRIVNIEGEEAIGHVADVIDAGERSDLEAQEDGITIVTDDKRLIEFYQSEIKAIEKVSLKTSKKSERAAG